MRGRRPLVSFFSNIKCDTNEHREDYMRVDKMQRHAILLAIRPGFCTRAVKVVFRHHFIE